MKTAIIGGTGYYELIEGPLTEKEMQTPFGSARFYLAGGDREGLIFLPRHGVDHSIPPHKINYRANIMALYQLGVKRIVALSAVGGLKMDIPPGAMVLVDQIIDWTQNRAGTFFDGGEWGLAHTDMTYPFCENLRRNLMQAAGRRGIEIKPNGVYMAFSGPRLETAAEIQLYARLGGDVVGMTGAPEVFLARELGIHYASVCTSINYAAGLVAGKIQYDKAGLEQSRGDLMNLVIEVLQSPDTHPCDCEGAARFKHRPTAWEQRQEIPD